MSNINPNNIDGTFPIQGQDNPSQGFRDNFTNIRNNFSYAQSELNDLQSKVLTTSALSGGSLTNNMSYNQIQNAQLFSPSYTFLNLGTPVSGSAVTLDYSQANYQKFTTNGIYTLAFSNWPTSGQIGVMTLLVRVSDPSHTIAFPTTLTGLNSIAGVNIISGVVTFDQAGDYVFQFRSADAGTSISVGDMSRNYSTLRDPSLYWNDETVPTLLVGYGKNQNMFNTILGLEQGQDMVSAFGSYNAVSVGNLAMANINNQTIDTGQMGGYSVSATRGNLMVPSVTISNSNDFLGYFNAITYTGTGVNQQPVYAQVSSIGFYATGSNATTGLGGNIAFFTHVPGTAANSVVQAASIENDQSARYFANLMLSGTSGGGSGTSSYVPLHNTSAGTVGQVAWDQSYFYLCTATNTWKRVALNVTSW